MDKPTELNLSCVITKIERTPVPRRLVVTCDYSGKIFRVGSNLDLDTSHVGKPVLVKCTGLSRKGLPAFPEIVTIE